MHRRAIVATLVIAVIAPFAIGSAHAQTPAERCLTMRLALLGATLSQRLHCHAWAVGTRTAPSESCLALGDTTLAERLRSAGCATEEEIATLLDLARAGSDALVESQTVDSRVAEFESGRWSTDVIIDLARIYDPAMAWPDESCRELGFCGDLYILACETTEGAGGALATTCRSVPESGTESLGSFSVYVAENTPLPTGEILARAGDGSTTFEVIVTLSPDGQTYTGRGHAGTLPIFIRGHRIG
jgi:hypothetical protein